MTPVGIGVEKGTVAVGLPVAVIMIRVELVGLKGADGVKVPIMPPPVDPPACAQVPDLRQKYPTPQHIESHGLSHWLLQVMVA